MRAVGGREGMPAIPPTAFSQKSTVLLGKPIALAAPYDKRLSVSGKAVQHPPPTRVKYPASRSSLCREKLS